MPFITFVPFILLSAAFGGIGPGLLATGFCALESIYFATEPVHSFAIHDSRNWLGVGALTLTGFVASLLFERLKNSHASQRAAYLELATVQRSAPVMLLVVDDALRVRKANDLARRFAAADMADLLGLGPGSTLGCVNAVVDFRGCGFGPGCEACQIRQTVSDTLRNGVPHTAIEVWVTVSIDGRPQKRCLEISTVPMQLDGNRRSALICGQDITERKNAEGELRKQRDALQRQAALIDLSNDAIIVADAHHVITAWNQGAAELYGWTEEEALGRAADRLLRTRAAISSDTIAGILSEAGRWDGELEQVRHDGTDLTVDSRRVLLRDSLGGPSALLEINRDITERKRAREHLLAAHRRTTTIVESISDGFTVFDPSWRYTFVNAAAARLLHKSREQLLGKVFWDLWPSTTGTPLERTFRRAMDEHTPLQIEAFHPEPLDAWFDVRCYPSAEGLSVFFTDVTQRKNAEDENRRLNAELEQRVRDRTAQIQATNKELETFAYSVSHDLRAPLRGIDGWSTALLEDFGAQLNDDARHCLQRIGSEVQKMSTLIDDLLRLSRVTRAPIERGSVDLSALSRTIADNLREIHAGRQIEFSIQPGLTASADAQLLEIAMTNLMNNAAKFTGHRSTAHIEVGSTEWDGQPAFHVRDNGAGFDMANARSLFGPFQRLHRASEFPGTGIGLATVQRIIHRHGGRVWADAEVDHGATFYFTLG